MLPSPPPFHCYYFFKNTFPAAPAFPAGLRGRCRIRAGGASSAGAARAGPASRSAPRASPCNPRGAARRGAGPRSRFIRLAGLARGSSGGGTC